MTNQQLLDFIKQQLQLGKDKENISKELLVNGWNTQDVEEGFVFINNQNTQPSSKNTFIEPKRKKISFPILVIFTVLILIFLGPFRMIVGILGIPLQSIFLGTPQKQEQEFLNNFQKEKELFPMLPTFTYNQDGDAVALKEEELKKVNAANELQGQKIEAYRNSHRSSLFNIVIKNFSGQITVIFFIVVISIGLFVQSKRHKKQITDNRFTEKEKMTSKWTVLIPLIQFFGCGFLFMLSLGLCGFPSDSAGPNCGLGKIIGLIDIVILLGLPFLALIFLLLKPIPGYKKVAYPVVTFLVGIIIPLLLLGFFIFQKMSYKSYEKEVKKSKDIIATNRAISLNIENYSITTEPATEITNHGAVLNVDVKKLINGISPDGEIGFYIGLSKTNMEYIGGVRCDGFNEANSHCDSDLNIRQGEPILPLKPNTTYYFTGAIIFHEYKPDGSLIDGKIKRSGKVLSFTTLNNSQAPKIESKKNLQNMLLENKILPPCVPGIVGC